MAAETYTLILPAHWRQLDLDDGAAASIEALVEDATARLPRDSSAAVKHRLRARLSDKVEDLRQTDGAHMSVMYFPVPQGPADVLPVSLSCGRLVSDTQVAVSETTNVLLAVVKTNPTSKPVDADGVVALRTHSFRDITQELVAEAEAAAVGLPNVTSGKDELGDQRAFQLRVKYLFAAPGSADWHLIVGSATVPSDDAEHEVCQALFGLFDAMVSGVKWIKADAHA